MAETKTRKTTTKAASDAASIQEREVSRPIVPKDIDPNQYVTVRNGFQGQLVYQSKRTGETFIWSNFGDEQEIELRELKNAKNSSKKFFENNWFMFDEPWIIDYLGVRQFYKNALPIDSFDDVFTKKPAELKKIIASLSDGQKRSLAYRANELIHEKKLDSLSVIEVLEDSLHIQLIEK